MPVLEITDLVAGYGDSVILDGVHLQVAPGELVTVVGPNGAGKSTLLKVVVGLLSPRRGSIKLHGEEIAGVPAERLVRKGLAYVPQVANVFPSLSVAENLELMLPRGTSRRDIKRAIDRTVGFLPALKPKLRASAGLLSGGERQMLAMARALVTTPQLIVMDEPSAALSPILVDTIFKKIADIHEVGTPILLVEQNARKALSFSTRGYVLDQGRNALEGTGRDLLANPEVGRLYLGG
ncbi:MAG: ABC transporter ATP-binding protein [Chloroflexota bacterium]|nr:ABC transporter ATP-binding protein [Chloroflexota bacterium]